MALRDIINMSIKKKYNRPNISVVSLDVDISICMTSENVEPDPGDKPTGETSVQGSSNAFSTPEKASGIEENPFK